MLQVFGDLGPCGFVMWRRQKPHCRELKSEWEVRKRNQRIRKRLQKSSVIKGDNSYGEGTDRTEESPFRTYL